MSKNVWKQRFEPNVSEIGVFYCNVSSESIVFSDNSEPNVTNFE